MLYVFLVDTGVMVTLDMNIALESVLMLKKAIQARCNIPVEKQVLLINGGDSLENDHRVCQYSGTGTDTSPIYLFNKAAIEQLAPPSITPPTPGSLSGQQFFSNSPPAHGGSPQFGSPFSELANSPTLSSSPQGNLAADEQQLKSMRTKVQDALSLQPSMGTIVTRTEIARQLCDITVRLLADCETLIREQHLQHQGWQAVIANLEDVGIVFLQGADNLKQNFTSFLECKDEKKILLKLLPTDLLILECTPIVKFQSTDDEKNTTDTELERMEQESQPTNLLEWINAKDTHFSLQQMADSCLTVMEHFSEEHFNQLFDEVEHIRMNLENEENKKIKKIEDRLYLLDETLAQAKKIVAEQSGLTNAFIQNHNSVSAIRDQSIYSDLCTSHQTQLKLMLENLEKLGSFKRRYLKAKNELIFSLHSRLRLVTQLEKDLSLVNSKILIYSENLRKLRRQLQVLSQVHQAPRVYFQAVNELVRRREFSQKFKQWAQKLSSKVHEVYKVETIRRKEFNSIISDHFLKSLFVGLDDEFPLYFAELPEFDCNLPKANEQDVEKLRKTLTAIVEKLRENENKNCFTEPNHEDKETDNLEMASLKIRENDETDNGIKKSTKNDLLTNLKIENPLLHETIQLLEELKIPCLYCDHSEDNNEIQSEDSKSSSILPESDASSLQKQSSTDTAEEAIEEDEQSLNWINKLREREAQIKRDYELKVQRMQEQFDTKLNVELEKLRTQLRSEHRFEMESIRSRFKLACALERSTLETSVIGESTTKSMCKPNEPMREVDKQVEQLRKSEHQLLKALSQIRNKLDEDLESLDSSSDLCAAIREILEVSKLGDRLSSPSLMK